MKFLVTVGNDGMSATELLSFANLMNGASTAALTNMSGQTYGTAPAAQSDDDEPANAAAPAVDSTGLPWDERIHAKSKAVKENGNWRSRRGVSDALVTQVETELRARGNGGMYMPQVQQQPIPQHPQFTAPPTGNIPMPDPAQQQYAPPVAQPQQQYAPPVAQQPQYQQPPQQQYAPPVAQQPQYQQQPAPQLQPIDFGTFMQTLAPKMVPGSRVDANYLASVCARLSQQFQREIPDITKIAADQNLINATVAIMSADGTW